MGRARLCKPKNHGFRAGRGGLTIPYRPTVPTGRATKDLLFRVRCPKKDRPCATMDRNGSEWIGMEFRLGFTPPRRLRSIPIHCREGRSRNKPKGPESQKNSGTPIFAWVPGGQKIVQTDGPYVLETVEINGAWSKKAWKSRFPGAGGPKIVKFTAFEVFEYLAGQKIVQTNGPCGLPGCLVGQKNVIFTVPGCPMSQKS